MIDEIVDAIAQIPFMIEFLIGAFIYLVISTVLGGFVSDVAQDTICELPGITYWFACFYLTNPVIAFITTVGTVIAIGFVFRAKFL